jgi:hypothetical protein
MGAIAPWSDYFANSTGRVADAKDKKPIWFEFFDFPNEPQVP